MDDRTKHVWAVWLTVALIALPVLYVTSFGPACWWFASTDTPGQVFLFPCVSRAYWPIGWLAINGPQPIQWLINWYATRHSEPIMLPTHPDGHWQPSVADPTVDIG